MNREQRRKELKRARHERSRRVHRPSTPILPQTQPEHGLTSVADPKDTPYTQQCHKCGKQTAGVGRLLCASCELPPQEPL